MQRPNRIMTRSNTMNREKRGIDSNDGDEVDVEPKRQKIPALASVIVEALKVDSLQKLCSSLEPILRRVVSEEVERALARLGHTQTGARSSPQRIEGRDGRNLQLHFRSRLAMPLFTGGKVEGEQGAAIHVVLLDASTGHVVTSGPEAYAKLDIVVLEGDFNNEDDDGWTKEEFESHVVKEREGKRPLLTGDLQVSLKEGVGTLGELTFTDNSSWIRSRKFRLGLKIASGHCEGIRVREAKSEDFTVKDHRGELYKKHYPPALKDEVWRLEKIGKDGAFHKRLNKAGIYTVEDFLRLVVRDSHRLRNILGSGMSNRMWEVLVEHAKTCVLGGKYYIYYSDDTRNVGAIFNNIYEFTGLVAGGQYYTAESLDDNQKIFADALVKKAYDNWMHAIEYDGKALLSIDHTRRTNRNEPIQASPQTYPKTYDHLISQASIPISPTLEKISVDSTLNSGGANGYTNNQMGGCSSNLHNMIPSAHIQYDNNNVLAPQNQYSNPQQPLPPATVTRSNSTSLALGPPQPALPYDNSHPTSSYDDEYLTEEEIRMRSHQMLENDEMQDLLRVFSMGGGTHSGNLEDGFGFPSFMPSPFPNFTFEDDRSRPSGRAGWLKIKAAMRWGIFIRKKAAERRAQLVELDD